MEVIIESKVVPQLSDVVDSMEKRRKQLEAQGNYDEAQKVLENMKRIGGKCSFELGEALLAEQEKDLQIIQNGHEEEMREFDMEWNKKIQDFEVHGEHLIAELEQRHKDEYQKFLDDLPNCVQPVRPHWSRRLLELRDKEARHVRSLNYPEAQRAKKEADDLEQVEIQKWRETRAVKAGRIEERFLDQQKKEMLGLKKRIETARTNLLQKQISARARLVRRYINARAVLEAHHKSERRQAQIPEGTSLQRWQQTQSRPGSAANAQTASSSRPMSPRPLDVTGGKGLVGFVSSNPSMYPAQGSNGRPRTTGRDRHRSPLAAGSARQALTALTGQGAVEDNRETTVEVRVPSPRRAFIPAVIPEDLGYVQDMAITGAPSMNFHPVGRQNVYDLPVASQLGGGQPQSTRQQSPLPRALQDVTTVQVTYDEPQGQQSPNGARRPLDVTVTHSPPRFPSSAAGLYEAAEAVFDYHKANNTLGVSVGNRSPPGLSVITRPRSAQQAQGHPSLAPLPQTPPVASQAFASATRGRVAPGGCVEHLNVDLHTQPMVNADGSPGRSIRHASVQRTQGSPSQVAPTYSSLHLARQDPELLEAQRQNAEAAKAQAQVQQMLMEGGAMAGMPSLAQTVGSHLGPRPASQGGLQQPLGGVTVRVASPGRGSANVSVQHSATNAPVAPRPVSAPSPALLPPGQHGFQHASVSVSNAPGMHGQGLHVTATSNPNGLSLRDQISAMLGRSGSPPMAVHAQQTNYTITQSPLNRPATAALPGQAGLQNNIEVTTTNHQGLTNTVRVSSPPRFFGASRPTSALQAPAPLPQQPQTYGVQSRSFAQQPASPPQMVHTVRVASPGRSPVSVSVANGFAQPQRAFAPMAQPPVASVSGSSRPMSAYRTAPNQQQAPSLEVSINAASSQPLFSRHQTVTRPGSAQPEAASFFKRAQDQQPQQARPTSVNVSVSQNNQQQYTQGSQRASQVSAASQRPATPVAIDLLNNNTPVLYESDLHQNGSQVAASSRRGSAHGSSALLALTKAELSHSQQHRQAQLAHPDEDVVEEGMGGLDDYAASARASQQARQSVGSHHGRVSVGSNALSASGAMQATIQPNRYVEANEVAAPAAQPAVAQAAGGKKDPQEESEASSEHGGDFQRTRLVGDEGEDKQDEDEEGEGASQSSSKKWGL